MTRVVARPRHRIRQFALWVVLFTILGGTLSTFAIASDTLGAGEKWEAVLARVDRFLAGPVPDRETRSTVRVTDPPKTPPPSLTAAPSVDPSAAPASTPTTLPARVPVDVDIVADHVAVFASQAEKDWCAVAGTQMVLAVLGLADTSDETQRQIAGRVREWESYDDSHNGDWGPAAIALALDAYGAPGYEIRAFETRSGALRDAGVAIETTGSPAILLTWRGAHTWVMTGFRADADPAIFKNAKVEGTYILDRWYPRISSIWGPSDPAGTFQDAAEMQRNFLPWKRPEGAYPDRDGLWITVVPTQRAPPAG